MNFKDFEQKWAKYKVYILYLKLFQLALLAIIMSDVATRQLSPDFQNVLASLSAAIAMLAFFGRSKYQISRVPSIFIFSPPSNRVGRRI